MSAALSSPAPSSADRVERPAPAEATAAARRSPPSRETLRGLDWLNFFLADVQSGVGPFLAIYLVGAGWNEQTTGVALTVGGIAGIVAQTPVGALIDRLRAKRALVAVGIAALAIGALIIAFRPSFTSVLLAQMLIGVSSTVFAPAVVAISLGVVGRGLFDRRQGRNQTFNSAGNVAAAVLMGLIGYYWSNRDIFLFVVAFTAPTLWMLASIRAQDIDYNLARGADAGSIPKGAGGISDLLRDRALMTFLACAVLFHFANAAMLPLLGEMLAKGHGRTSMMFMSACVVTTQLIVTALSSWSGLKAQEWGRKPLLLIAFAVLPLRGILYTLTESATYLIAIQILDGIAAAIFGVVSVLVIADLTKGTGRFNLAMGAITTAVGIGAALSQSIAGSIVHRFGYHAGFIFLASVAALALVAIWTFMPETKARIPRSAPSA